MTIRQAIHPNSKERDPCQILWHGYSCLGGGVMVKAAKIILIIAVIILVVGTLARLAKYGNEHGIPAFGGATPQALWRLSVALMALSMSLCLLEIAEKKGPQS